MELSKGGTVTDMEGLGGRAVAATGTVAAGSGLTVAGVVVGGKVTVLPVGTPTVPYTPITYRYGTLLLSTHTYFATPSFKFNKPGMAKPNQTLLNSIFSLSSSPPATDSARGTASSTESYNPVGTLTKVNLSGTASVTSLTAGNTGDAWFFADDPITFSPQSKPFEFNQSITSLGLGIDSTEPNARQGIVGVEYDAYSSLVPTTDGSLGLLYRLGFSLSSDGEFDDFFYGAPQLGFTSQSQMDIFLANLVQNDLVVTTGPNPSVSLLNPSGFNLFPSAISLDSSDGAVFDFSTQSFATVAPEPASCLLFATGTLALLGYSWRRRKYA
jgi:hypothetical protein